MASFSLVALSLLLCSLPHIAAFPSSLSNVSTPVLIQNLVGRQSCSTGSLCSNYLVQTSGDGCCIPAADCGGAEDVLCTTDTHLCCTGDQICVSPPMVTDTAYCIVNPPTAPLPPQTVIALPTGQASITVNNSSPAFRYFPPTAWGSAASTSSCTNSSSLKVTSSMNAAFNFTFSGTNVSIMTLQSTDGGPYTVQIDGGEPQMFNSSGSDGSCGSINPNLLAPSPALFIRAGEPQAPARTVIVKNVGSGKLQFDSVMLSNAVQANGSSTPSPSPGAGAGSSPSTSGAPVTLFDFKLVAIALAVITAQAMFMCRGLF